MQDNRDITQEPIEEQVKAAIAQLVLASDNDDIGSDEEAIFVSVNERAAGMWELRLQSGNGWRAVTSLHLGHITIEEQP